MFGINLFNYLDRYVAAAVAPMVKRELNLTDSEIGLFGTAFLLVYAIAAVPFGYWGDRGVRRNVIAVGGAFSGVPTLRPGFARNCSHPCLSRAVVGIGEASYYPAGTSLMSDYFPKEQRSRVMSIWGAGSTVGIALGFAGGGYLADKFGWRAVFFIAGGPGLLFALLAYRMREPLRGAVERGPSLAKTADAGLKQFLELLRIPTLRATIIAQTLLFFVLASNAFWLPTVLQRRFELSATKAGLLAGVVIVVGGLIGTLAGGLLADWLGGNLQLALLITSPTLLILAAVAAAMGLKTVKQDTERMEQDWAARGAEAAAT